MKFLRCETCGCKIKFGSKRSLNFRDIYFCCKKCLYIYLSTEIFSISDYDFETDGEEETCE